jgi:hypothetical protein
MCVDGDGDRPNSGSFKIHVSKCLIPT